MKRSLSILLVLAICLSLCGNVFAANSGSEVASTVSPVKGPETTNRTVVSLNGEWSFTDPDVGTPETVTVPHSWDCFKSAYNLMANVKTCTYEKTVNVAAFEGKKLMLQFDGVNKIAKIFIDDVQVGSHIGGFSTFYVDITDAAAGKETVQVRVEVTNMSFDTMPVNSDFTHFAGIYRDVNLVAVDPVASISNSDYGSNGVYMNTQVDLSSGNATLSPVVMVDYSYTATSVYDALELQVETVLYDAEGTQVGATSEILDLQGNEVAHKVALPALTVKNANLWNGTLNPYLYTAVTTLKANGDVVDTATSKVGFRTYEVRDGEFYLNGELYELRGVGMHQETGAITNVTTDAQKEADIALVLEMGANALRTCHYPHDQYIYDLCDQYGIVVWSEIPFYLVMLETDSFKDNVEQSLKEMVFQGYNHPSIIVWGIANEVNVYTAYQQFYPTQATPEQLGAFMQKLSATVHEIDPSRLVGEAEIDNTAYSQETAGWTTAESGINVVGFNIYTGWYSNVNGATNANKIDRIVSTLQRKLGTYQERFDTASGNTTSYVLTEYGAGANINQHDDLGPDFAWGGTDASKGYVTSGQYQPEEYQSYVHEGMIMAIYGDETNNVTGASDLWAAFTWAMFDFSCYRNEGDTTRLNTKGLVTADRSTKKDAFYLYKANWNTVEPFTHICSSRYTTRTNQTIDVKVYSNCDSVELVLNGTSYGMGTKQQDGVFVWENVKLAYSGEANTAVAVGYMDGENVCSDTCDTWVYSSNTNIVVNNELDKEYDGEVCDDPDYTITADGEDATEALNEAGVVTISWFKVVTDEEGEGYPDYGSDTVKYVPVDGKPSEVGDYVCVITVEGGSNDDLTWGSARLEIPFSITPVQHAEHTWDEGTVTLVPACVAEGEMTYHCTGCDETKTEPIEKDPENHVGSLVTVNAVEATCGTAGYTGDVVCDACEAVVEEGEEIPATGRHTWYDGVVTKEPTCSEEGEKTYTCSVCGTTSVEPMPKLDHDFDAVVTDPSCEGMGYTTHTCSMCGVNYVDTLVEALGHDYVTEVVEPTCNTLGYTVHTCTRCGDSYLDTYVPATDHDYLGVVTVEPTCTSEGTMTFTCSVCGASYELTLPKADHEMETVQHDPSCLGYGYTEHICVNCGYNYISDMVQPLGHSLVLTGAVEPTCVKDGYYGDMVCSVCGEVQSEGHVIAALGHTWGEWVVVDEPTCFAEGTEKHTCTVCDEEETRATSTSTENCPCYDYTDLDNGAWYHEGVDYVLNNGIMQGIGNGQFAPGMAMTRAQMVQIMYRLAGAPEVEPADTFTDVKTSAWYAEAVAWAVESGVTNGVGNGMFAPDRTITRQEMIVMLYRYANIFGYDTSKTGELNYADASDVSGYAVEAMSWAVANGLVVGVPDHDTLYLNPKDNLTRAQVAVIVMRFAKTIE